MIDDQRINTLARSFSTAASDIGHALFDHLVHTAPETAESIARAVQSGERLSVCMEFDQRAGVISLATIDDYQRMKVIRSVAGTLQPIQIDEG